MGDNRRKVMLEYQDQMHPMSQFLLATYQSFVAKAAQAMFEGRSTPQLGPCWTETGIRFNIGLFFTHLRVAYIANLTVRIPSSE